MFDNLFRDVGKKIQVLAKGLMIVGVACSVIIGLVVMAGDESMLLVGLLIMLVGSLVSWISSWFLYGYGEIIKNTAEIAENTRGGSCAVTKEDASQANDPERLARLQKLLSDGMITEEEYRVALSK